MIAPSNEDSDYEEEELDDTIIEHDSNLSVPYESDGEDEDDPNNFLISNVWPSFILLLNKINIWFRKLICMFKYLCI